ncbi:MAG: GNAT family N-acetyltransferase [Rikenellaceae bacterium]|nr:GNAT family N-acetyltransferase [Rikenellaceae bacterium]
MQNRIYKIVSSPEELLKAYCIRSIVFVEEQECPYREEFDRLDLTATHFLALDGDEPVATARVRVVPGAVKFERLAVRKQYRGGGAGRDFFGYVLSYMESLGPGKIILHAQAHLTGFYESFGFVRKGDLFTEAGIPHYYMEKKL